MTKHGNIRITGNPMIVKQSDDQTWAFENTCMKISHAIVQEVSADTTGAVIVAKDSSSAEASDYGVRDVRSGVNTVIWSEPIVISNLYIRNLSAGILKIWLE